MDGICNDIILEIFSYLPLKERVRCSQVSHRWRTLFQYGPIYSVKICRRPDPLDQLELHQYHKFKCNNHLHHPDNLKVIYYENFNQLNSIIKNLLPQLRRLKALHFEVYSLFELVEANLDSIIDLELEHFEVIYSCNMYIEGKIEKLLSKLGNKLKHLIIEPKQYTGTPFTCSVLNNNRRLTSYFGRVGLELIENYLPNLEVLKFEPLTFVIESLHPIRLPCKLKTLALPKVRLSVTELFAIQKNSNLNELHFFDINIPLFKIICNMQNLKILKLSKIRINEANELRFLSNLTNLEHLQFKLHYKVIDEVLCELMQKLTKIRRLCLINCCIDNFTIKEMTNAWPKLEYLELHNRMNNNLTDQCLDYLLGLDTLKSLALPYASLTNQSLCNYIEKSKIQQLDVSNVININEQVFHSMVSKALKNLHHNFYLVILGHRFYIQENLCKNLSVLLD